MSAESSFLTMRQCCPDCGEAAGILVATNGQNVVRCVTCDRFCYNAPKAETGEAARSVSRTWLKPSQKYRILSRDGFRCRFCGIDLQVSGHHIDHMVSVKDCMAAGMIELDFNSDDNLIALCEECNLGKGSDSLHPRLLAIALRCARRKSGAA